MNGKRAKDMRRALDAVRLPSEDGPIPLDNTDKWEHSNIVPVNLPFWIGGVFQWPLPVYYTSSAKRVRATMRGAYRALKRNVLIAKRDRQKLLSIARSRRLTGSFLSRSSRSMNYDRAKEQVHNNWIQPSARTESTTTSFQNSRSGNETNYSETLV